MVGELMDRVGSYSPAPDQLPEAPIPTAAPLAVQIAIQWPIFLMPNLLKPTECIFRAQGHCRRRHSHDRPHPVAIPLAHPLTVPPTPIWPLRVPYRFHPAVSAWASCS